MPTVESRRRRRYGAAVPILTAGRSRYRVRDAATVAALIALDLALWLGIIAGAVYIVREWL